MPHFGNIDISNIPLHKDAEKIRKLLDNSMPRTPARYTNYVKKNSPKSWIGDINPLDYNEAIIFGPVFKADAMEYILTVNNAFMGRDDIAPDIKTELWLSRGKCLKVSVLMRHAFWTRRLMFEFPPLSAQEIVKRIWDAITTAQVRPNVDPVDLARESLSHGPPYQALEEG
jgi:hypothetical protein